MKQFSSVMGVGQLQRIFGRDPDAGTWLFLDDLLDFLVDVFGHVSLYNGCGKKE